VKIGPVDPAIALLKLKKRKKLQKVKYIALPASLPSGLKIKTWNLESNLQVYEFQLMPVRNGVRSVLLAHSVREFVYQQQHNCVITK